MLNREKIRLLKSVNNKTIRGFLVNCRSSIIHYQLKNRIFADQFHLKTKPLTIA